MASPRHRRLPTVGGLALTAAVAFAACASDSSTEFSAAGERGRQLSTDLGCAGCHGADDREATIGPDWNGSWGTDIELDDGSTTTFDVIYVERSVRSPDAQRRAGDWIRMPEYRADQLTDDELADIVVYLEELG